MSDIQADVDSLTEEDLAALSDDPPSPAIPVDTFMTTAEVATLFLVTPETVVNWIKKGHLEAKKIEGYWRVYRRSVIAFANQKYNG